MDISIFQITFETDVTKSHLHPGDVLMTVYFYQPPNEDTSIVIIPIIGLGK